MNDADRECSMAPLGIERIGDEDADGVQIAAELPAGTIRFSRDEDVLLVLADDLYVKWALLEWCSLAPGKPAETLYAVLAHGSGPSGSLREARHTYFGDNGYVFHVRPELLTWAFEQLGEWFDFEGLRKA